MKKYTKFTAIILAAAMLCGCEKIPDAVDISDSLTGNSASESTSGDNGRQNTDTNTVNNYTVLKQSYVKKYEAEKGAFNGTAKDEQGELENPDNDGFVTLKKGQYLKQVATVVSSQFYRVIISARSSTGAAIKLYVGDSVVGSYSVPITENDESGSEYQLFAVDNLYMSVGMNTLKLTVESGTADIDCIVVENTDEVGTEVYNTGNVPVAENVSNRTVTLFNMLSDYYGKAVFLAQNVSCGTNAEINAVYSETQRYPAIRISELAPAVKDETYTAEMIDNDIALAEEWDKNGGICAYKWHWYSPNPIRGTGANDFDVQSALDGADAAEIALLDNAAIELQLKNDLLTQDAAELLYDIDKLAETLKKLEDADIPVLFEPVPDGDTGLFWWGKDSESYKSLWKLIFLRLTKYNGIKNLIWVWNNSDFEYYPGDKYVDVIGQSFYEKTDSSFAGCFGAIASNTASGRKMLAVTACDTLPNIDFMSRDNAMWLWIAPDSGEYVIDDNGNISYLYNKKSAVRFAYNNEKCITRDELKAMGY